MNIKSETIVMKRISSRILMMFEMIKMDSAGEISIAIILDPFKVYSTIGLS